MFLNEKFHRFGNKKEVENSTSFFYFKSDILFLVADNILTINKNNIFAITMLAPVGSEKAKDSIRPSISPSIDIIAETITNDLKLLVIFRDIIAGNTIRLDIIKVPIILIPITTIRAVIRDITK